MRTVTMPVFGSELQKAGTNLTIDGVRDEIRLDGVTYTHEEWEAFVSKNNEVFIRSEYINHEMWLAGMKEG